MSGRRAGTSNWLPGHFPLLVQAVAHVKETLTDDVTAGELDTHRENAFKERMVAAIRNGDEFVNTEYAKLGYAESYPNGNAADGYMNQKYDTSVYTDCPRTGYSISVKFNQLQAQGLHLNSIAKKIYLNAHKGGTPSGDNNVDIRRARVTFAAMHSRKDVPDEQKEEFVPETHTLENLLKELKTSDKYKNFTIGSGIAQQVKLKDGLEVWLKFGPFETEKTFYCDWDLKTKQERVAKRNTMNNSNTLNPGTGDAPLPKRTKVEDKNAVFMDRKEHFLYQAHDAKMREIKATKEGEKEVIDANAKKRRQSFENQTQQQVIQLLKDAKEKRMLLSEQLTKVQMNTSENISEERLAKVEARLTEELNTCQDEIDELQHQVHGFIHDTQKENTPEPPSSKKSGRDESCSDEDFMHGAYRKMQYTPKND